MRKFSNYISNNTSNNIYNKTSINAQNSENNKFENLIKTRLLRKKSLVVKSIQKRKKLKDKFIPKNDISYPEFKKNARNKKEKKVSKKIDKNEEEEKNIPFKLKILKFQEKMNKTNYLLKDLRKENKMFTKDFKRSLLFEQKQNKFNINLIINNRKNVVNDLYKNNIFNQSLLLTDKKRVPDYILENLDNKESKEDLKIIESIKRNFLSGQGIITPDFLNTEKNEKNILLRNIIKMKKENQLLEENISNLEKNWASFYDFELNKDQSKELKLINNKLSFFNNNKNKKKLQLNLGESKETKSTKNIKTKLILSSPIKGEYKLVTKCEIKDKPQQTQKNDIFETYSKKLQLKDFFNTYNKAKVLLNQSRKGKFTSDIINYNYNIYNIKRDKSQILKMKFFQKEKYLNSLSSCLESFTEKNSKDKDIVNLYTFMKKANLQDISDLVSFYKKKYNKDYEPENVISGLKKHPEQYNLVNKMHELDKLNSFIKDKNHKKRKAMLENVKSLDEIIKNGGIKLLQRNLDFN